MSHLLSFISGVGCGVLIAALFAALSAAKRRPWL